MGMEALETVVGYWEDALNAYQSAGKHKLLTTSEEAEFTKMLEGILEAAYQLQVDNKLLLIHLSLPFSEKILKVFEREREKTPCRNRIIKRIYANENKTPKLKNDL